MAAGIPTVATAIGTIFRIIKPGENGFLVKSPEEWKQALARLMEDEMLRKSLGTAASKTVEEHYSIKANQGTYLRILEQEVNESWSKQ
jgi:glycosyltransferase involved in cell wall biosynthesis